MVSACVLLLISSKVSAVDNVSKKSSVFSGRFKLLGSNTFNQVDSLSIRWISAYVVISPVFHSIE